MDGVLFLRCFFLVLRHTPGTPGTGLTSLLLTGGGCRMGLGARVRHTGRPAAHSRIPVIPGEGARPSGGGAPTGPRPPRPPAFGWAPEAFPQDPPTPGILGPSGGWAVVPSAPTAGGSRMERLLRAPPTPESASNRKGRFLWAPPTIPVEGRSHRADRRGRRLMGPTRLSFQSWISPARAGWTGPVPFKFFTGSAGTLRGEKRAQLDSSSTHQIRGSCFAFWLLEVL